MYVRVRTENWADAFFKGREAYGALLRKAKEGLGFVGEARNLTEAYPFLDRMRSQVVVFFFGCDVQAGVCVLCVGV